MQEDLLGYLLGALEPDEMARVEQALREDPKLRSQLVHLEKSLEPLDQAWEPMEAPPEGLVGRTLDALPPLPVSETSSGSARSGSPSQTVQLSPAVDRGKTSSWRWQDWFAASTSAAVVLSLLLPAISNGRFEARKVACQDQLRRFGSAITQFVTREKRDRLPEVKSEGPEAFAGIYAVRLRDAGLLDDASLRWCPSFDLPTESRPTSFADQWFDKIASLEELHNASVNQLREFHRFAGGHYAYNLGVKEVDGRFESPRYEQRSGFAVLSDVPLGAMVRGVAAGNPVGHSGRGLNVLYEDGHVRFISADSFDNLIDHPWLNHHGDIEAGITPDDASLAPSWRPPFRDSIQR